MDIYPTPAEVLRDALVDRPVLGFRPHAAARAAKWFVDHFPGETLYAVKANDLPAVLNTLFDAGIRHFDVASLTELRTMSKFPGSDHAHHASREAKAFHRRSLSRSGVRTFALDLRRSWRRSRPQPATRRILRLSFASHVLRPTAKFRLRGSSARPGARRRIYLPCSSAVGVSGHQFPRGFADDVPSWIRSGLAKRLAADRASGNARRHHRRGRRISGSLSRHGAAVA